MVWMRNPAGGEPVNVESVLDPETHRSQVDILRSRGWQFVNANERIPVYFYDDGGQVRRGSVEAHQFDDVIGPGVGGGARTPELDRIINIAYAEEARGNAQEALSLSRMIGIPDELAALLSFTGPGMMANPAAAASTADTLSLGGVSALARQVNPEAAQWLHDVREANPYSDIAGELQGLALPIPGGQAVRGGSSLSRLERLMSAAGPSGMGQEGRLIAERAIADLMGPAAVNQMRGRLTAGAVEGMAAGVATGFMDSMVQNSDLTGEILASHAGLGALLGLGGEALIGGTQRAWRWTRPGYNPNSAESLVDSPIADIGRNVRVEDVYPEVVHEGAREAIRLGELTQDAGPVARIYAQGGALLSTTDRRALEMIGTPQVQSLAAYAPRQIPQQSPNIARAGDQVLRASEEIAARAGRQPGPEIVNRLTSDSPGAMNRARDVFGSIADDFGRLSDELVVTGDHGTASLANRFRELSQSITQRLDDGFALMPQRSVQVARTVQEAVPIETGAPLGATRPIQVIENQLEPTGQLALRGMSSEGATAYQAALNVRDDILPLLTNSNVRVREAAERSYTALRVLLGDDTMFGGAARRLNAIETAFGNPLIRSDMAGYEGAFSERVKGLLNRIGDTSAATGHRQFSPTKINSHFLKNIGPGDPTTRELAEAIEGFSDEVDRSLREVGELYEDTTDRALIDRLRTANEALRETWKATRPMAEALGAFQTVWRSRNQGSGSQLGVLFGVGAGSITGNPLIGFGVGTLAQQLAAPGSVPFIIGGIRNTIAEMKLSPRIEALRKAFRSSVRVGETLGAAGRRALPTYVVRLSNRQERQEQYEEIRNRVYETAANPAILAEELGARTFYINHADPTVAGEVQQAALRANMLLRSLITEPVTDPSSGRAYPASAYEVDVVVDTVEALEDPLRLLDHFVEHTLNAEHVNAVRTVYPATFAALTGIVNQVQGEVLAEGGDIPFQTKAQLSILFGTDMDVAMSSSFTASMQSNYAQTTVGAESIQEPNHRPRMRRPRLSEDTRTGSQTVEAGLPQ